MPEQPPWRALLIGGASGVGKTHVSYALAHHYRVGLTEVDDFQVILERMTAPEKYPVLHFYRDHPDEFRRMDEEAKLAQIISYARVMAEALEHVIANHVEGGPPVVLEGDFILPSLAVQRAHGGIPARGLVRGLVIYEEDERQIARNLMAREGKPHPDRAHTSWRYSEWLRAEATRLGVPVLAAHPWDTVVARAIAVLDAPAGRE